MNNFKPGDKVRPKVGRLTMCDVYDGIRARERPVVTVRRQDGYLLYLRESNHENYSFSCEDFELANKFKVGDRVKCVKNMGVGGENYCSSIRVGTEYEVKDAQVRNAHRDEYSTVQPRVCVESPTSSWKDWYYPEEAFELVQPALVVIESPYAGDVEANVAYAKRCMADSLKRGEAPIASHLLYPGILDDNVPAERKQGIEAGLAWAEKATRSVFYIDRGISKGMLQGWLAAHKAGRHCEVRSLRISDGKPDDLIDVMECMAAELGIK